MIEYFFQEIVLKLVKETQAIFCDLDLFSPLEEFDSLNIDLHEVNSSGSIGSSTDKVSLFVNPS